MTRHFLELFVDDQSARAAGFEVGVFHRQRQVIAVRARKKIRDTNRPQFLQIGIRHLFAQNGDDVAATGHGMRAPPPVRWIASNWSASPPSPIRCRRWPPAPFVRIAAPAPSPKRNAVS